MLDRRAARRHAERLLVSVLAGALACAFASARTIASPRALPVEVREQPELAMLAASASAEPRLEAVSRDDRVAAAALTEGSRADATLKRDARTAFADGYLTLTPDFSSPDGVYDLVLHFHGNTELVEQSLAYARIGAVFVPQNLGTGSGPYEERFSDARALDDVLERVQAAMVKRGLRGARLGRVALVAWSAGYAAVLRILEHAEAAARVDAVILLDGIHIGRVAGKRAPAVDQIAPYARFARWAMDGQKLFTITHGDIAPDAYVGARDTTDVLLRTLGVLRYADGERGSVPPIPAALGVLSKGTRVPLEPLTLADRGQLRVRGYAGDGPEHHILHLLEMASIALPDLHAWWARPREASP